MDHLPKLIIDLALILIAGALMTLIFKKIRQPVVLGYIIAGMMTGPHISIFPTVVDAENIETLAEIGVIFVLFSLGLDFSFKKLMRVGGTASITALIEIVFMVIAGFISGKLMGWSTMDSLFLGGMLASSSTVIIIRAFDELGVKTKQFARIVYGVLVVEDIVVVLLMVLLSTMAVSRQFEGVQLFITMFRLLFFLAFWFIAGIFLLPTFLRRIKRLIDDETLLILAIALCLGMVLLAVQVGFSAALGAFVMGSVIAETTSAEKVERIVRPVKDLFGAVFFVSVGMLIDPAAIYIYKWPILFVTLVTLFGKFFSSVIGALLSGQPFRQSVQVGMSLGQIGEFAFIVATLGLSLGVTSDFLFPVAVGASVLTTFTTPYRIKYSDQVHEWLLKIMPAKWIRFLSNYATGTQNIQAESNWKLVLKSYGNIVVTNGIIILAILLVALRFLHPFLVMNMPGEHTAEIITLIISLAVAAPFIWALMAKKPDNFAYKELWLEKKYNQGPLVVVEVIRNLLAVILIGLWVDSFFSTAVTLLVVLPAFIIALYLFSKRIQWFYQRIEKRFLSNLNARERAAAGENTLEENYFRKNVELQTNLQPWSAHIVDLEVGQGADFSGMTLTELAWRERYGINIAYIKRGDKMIHAPGRNHKLLPFDHVGIIATDEQMQVFKPVFDAVNDGEEDAVNIDDIVLQKIVVDEFTKLKGKTIRNSGVRESTDGLVVGIERNGERLLNPDSTTVFEWDDIVWIVGDRKKIQKLMNAGA